MEDPGGPYRVGLIALLLLCSALFSASETALFSITKNKLKEIAKQTNYVGRISHLFVVEPERILSTILVGNTLVNVFFTSTLTALLISSLSFARETTEGVAAVSAFLLLLAFGEIGPKTLASVRPLGVMGLTSQFLFVCSRILSPLSLLLSLGRKLFLARFPEEDEITHISQEQLIGTAVNLGEQSGAVAHTTGKAIRNIFAADDTPVRAVMTPRAKIHAVSDRDSASAVAEVMISTGHSRLPVYKGSVDLLIGIIHLKDLIQNPCGSDPISEFLRPIHHARASDSVTKVLRDLRQRHLHMCAVYNSQDRVIGICTLEDLVEEIVGEIVDEHDKPHTAAGGSLS